MTPPESACVISVGDELVLGEKLDSNSRDISRALGARDVRVLRHSTIADDRAALAHEITACAQVSGLVVVTGGLGPTLDDLTRDALADALGEAIVEDESALAKLQQWASSRTIELTPGQRRQSMRPSSAVCITNEHGTAPGLRARLRETQIICLPGPPREMLPMLESELARIGLKQSAAHRRTIEMLVVGVGEGDIGERLADLMHRDADPIVGTTASKGVVTCRIRPGSSAGMERLEEVEQEIGRRLSPYVFGSGDDTLPGAVVSLLAERRESLCVAESCTGGLLGAAMTEVPGSSACFAGGWLTYSNELKHEQLGVSQHTLASHGAVSAETAAEMASGALGRSNGAQHAVSITGIAGPGGGTDAKPVGTVFMAHAWDENVRVRRFLFPGVRDVVRQRAALMALAMIRLDLVGSSDAPLLWESADRAG